MNAHTFGGSNFDLTTSSLTQKQIEDGAFFQRLDYLRRADLTIGEMAVIMGFASGSGIYAREEAIEARGGVVPPAYLVDYAVLKFLGRKSINTNSASDEISQATGIKVCPVYASAIFKIGAAQGFFEEVRRDVYKSTSRPSTSVISLLANSRSVGDCIDEMEAASILAAAINLPVDPTMALECLKACEAEYLFKKISECLFRRTSEPLDFAYANIWERSLILATAKGVKYLNLGEGHISSKQLELLRAPLIQKGGAGWPALECLTKLDDETFIRTGMHDKGNRNFGVMVVIHPIGIESYDIAHESSSTILALHRGGPSIIIRPTTATLDSKAVKDFKRLHAERLIDDIKGKFISASRASSGDANTLFRAAFIYGKIR